MPDHQTWLAQLRQSVDELMPDEVQGMLEDEEDFELLDVRESDEIRQGMIPGATTMPRGFLERVEATLPDKDRQIVTYCAGGVRSLYAADTLSKLGYTNVSSMAGGYGRWSDMGFDTVEPADLALPAKGDGPAADQLARAAREQASTIDPDALQALLASGIDSPVVVDVREADEVGQGRITGSTHLTRGFIELKAASTIPDRSQPVVVHCGGGDRGYLAAAQFSELGYSDVKVLEGGYRAWKAAGHPVDTPFTLSDDDRARYARHLNIPEVGPEGQAKLLQSRVLLIGAGGLGCPTAQYLAAAGIGTLGILDFDVVDESNLQRQILHRIDTIGMAKTTSAKQALLQLNAGIEIVEHNERLDSTNVEQIFDGYDVVVDGTDNFPTRYLINDACVKLGIPNVHGSVYRFDGQVTVFAPSLGGPCYRCLYPEPPPPELAPSCAEAGVLGVLPGIIGCLQAMETIKVILAVGEPLVGKLLVYDGLRASFEIKKLFKDPDCEYCAEGKEFPGFVDYEFFCANPALV